MTVPAGGRGTTTVTPRAVRRIAERAVGEALPDGGAVTRGSASVRGASARVTVGVRLPYPVRADETAERIRECAQARAAALTGLSVPHADIRIDALSVIPVPPRRNSDDEAAWAEDTAYGDGHTAPRGGRGGRIRAQRRIPAAVTAAVGAVGCTLLLVDLATVRLGGTPAAWRTWLVDWASTHGPAETEVQAGGVLATLTSLWLLGCALLPGLRRGLEMTVPAPRLRAELDRSAAARVVQDRATDVAGVVRARVSVGRRRVLAGVEFGDPEQVRAEVVRVVEATLPELGLVRTPTLRVRIPVLVRPEPNGQRPSTEEPRKSTASSATAASAEQKEV